MKYNKIKMNIFEYTIDNYNQVYDNILLYFKQEKNINIRSLINIRLVRYYNIDDPLYYLFSYDDHKTIHIGECISKEKIDNYTKIRRKLKLDDIYR